MPALLALFFASGCAALIYEMVWFYLVQLVVGASSISVAVLLCAFMGGMALGSWLLPRRLAHWHPLRAIALLEGGIATLGILIPLGLPYVQELYILVAGHGAAAIATRALFCAVVLTPPTMLMGATLPIIARSTEFGRADRIGLLYMANLAGGAIGTAIAGFYLLRVYDTVVTTGVAVGLNVALAAAFWVLGRSDVPSSRPSDARPEPIVAPTVFYVAAGLSGVTSLGAEVIWTRQLSLLFGASVYTFSLVLSVFLAGLGIGGLVGSLLAKRAGNVRIALGITQALLALAIGFGSWAIVDLLPHWQPTTEFLPRVHASQWTWFAYDAARCAFAMLPATLLWGASFPLTLAGAESAGGSHALTGHVARVNATNTIGALAGAVGFTIIGMPFLGSHLAQQALVAIAAATAVALLWHTANRQRLWLGPSVAALAIAGLVVVPAVPARLIAYGRSVKSWDSIKQFFFVGEGATASIAVTLDTGGNKQFHIAGKVEASDMDIDLRLERMLGHVPALVHPHPKSVLIVGVGAGVTAGSLSIHPEIERIVVCDIEPLVPVSARAYFGTENHHVFDNPKVQLVFDDARHFLQTTTEKFDIITSDPIHPWVRGAATLYSLEYLTLAKNHLTPGGVVTQWIPLYETDIPSVKSELGTFARVFPDTTLWNPDMLEEGYDLVALGRAEQQPINEAEIQARIDASPIVKQSLAAVGLADAGAILSTYAGRGKDLAPWLADAEINRERSLRLQYLAGLAANQDQRYGVFEAIVNYRRYPADLFVASAGTESRLRSWYEER